MNDKDTHDAIQLLASGESQGTVADKIGVSQSTISRLAKKHQEMITIEAERMLSSLPDIIAHGVLNKIIKSNIMERFLA